MAVDLREQLQSSLGEVYRLERELGGGGMSRVFLAVETALGRPVVVKVLLPELAAGVSVDRFRREIQVAAHLQHPHIVPLLAAGDASGLPWFTMPYVTGESLRARLIRDGELPIAETVRILRDVASALAYAHAQGVVHRDIKPDNVLLSHGVAVVTDFGVAKALTVSSAEAALTTMGVSLGTPAYMAPEQASADPGMDHRVDVYAFGVTAYEMLTGQPPFSGRSPQAILGAHVAVLPEPVNVRRPGIPPLLVTLVMKCLEKRAADRPQTAGDIIATLDMLTTPSGGTVPVSAPHPTVVTARPGSRERVARLLRRYGPVVGGAALAAGIVLWARPSRPAPPAAQTGGDATPTAPAVPAQPPAAAPEPAPDTAPAAQAPAITTPPPAPAPRPRPPRTETPVALAPEESALLGRLRADAELARGRAVAAGADAALLARGDSALVAAESLQARGRIAQAAARLSTAATLWTSAADAPPPARAESIGSPETAAPALVPPAETAAKPAPARPPPAAAPPPGDAAEEINALFAEYAAAIESRSLPAIRRLYPGMRPEQARDWERFFEAVGDVDVELRVTRLDLSGSTAEAGLAGVYTFTNPSIGRDQREPVSFVARLRRDRSGWRIESLR